MYKSLRNFLSDQKVRNYLIVAFFILLVISCAGTYAVFCDIGISLERSYSRFVLFLYADVICLLILLFLCSNKILHIWSIRKNKGSKITLRLISTFSLLSIIPSICVCVFSVTFFHNGIESWFDEKHNAVLKESLFVAESYLSEHKQHTQEVCEMLARAIEYNMYTHSDKDLGTFTFDENVNAWISGFCAIKGISCAIVIDSSLQVIARTRYSGSLHFVNISSKDIENVLEKKCVIIETAAKDDSIKAIAVLESFGCDRLFLLIEKNIDTKIVSHIHNTRNAFNEHQALLMERKSLEITFILVFLLIGVLLLAASISVALVYSLRFVNPVNDLIDISEKIISGNYDARVNEDNQYEEITLLTKTFNIMITQIQDHQNALIKMNEKLDEKIKFSDSVLSGISSGVIGVTNGSVYICNNVARTLLNKEIKFGDKLHDISPSICLMIQHIGSDKNYIEEEMQIERQDGVLILSVRIDNISDKNSNDTIFVITFNDLTNVVLQQRKAAWSDVARRVAHEIKNPLTPIQLAAERLRRKYESCIAENDRYTFSELISVIIRQVGDIKRLIDEFTFFARLPNPVFRRTDVCDICDQAVFFMQSAIEDIEIIKHYEQNHYVMCDDRMIHQAIVNLIQNASNALRTSELTDKKIYVSVLLSGENVDICVEDNGPGLPDEKREYLAVPYFTLMPKGTGLGLAIVKKIAYDHGGSLVFDDSLLYGGAKVAIRLPVDGVKESNE